jgi:hypothetical protein
MKYVPPFDLIKQYVQISNVKGEVRVSASYEDFVTILKLMISSTEIDEEWYLRRYEDIAQAVRNGDIASAKRHFVDDGYFEGRIPAPLAVDGDWYLSEYPDVAESVRRGDFTSAQQHFAEDGYREGRLPFRI